MGTQGLQNFFLLFGLFKLSTFDLQIKIALQFILHFVSVYFKYYNIKNKYTNFNSIYSSWTLMNTTMEPSYQTKKHPKIPQWVNFAILHYALHYILIVSSHCIVHLYEIYTNIQHFFHTKALKHIYLHLVVIPKSLQHFEIDIFSLCGNKNVSLSFCICLCVCVFLAQMFFHECVCKYYLAWRLQKVWEHFEGSSPSDH